MTFVEDHIFHIYNRGNNRQRIFFNDENYFYFLSKVRKYIYPYCDMLAYCLMPNYFNFQILANEKTVSIDDKGRNLFSEGIKVLLSSYSKAINVQENRVGSLFTQNTHGKCVDSNQSQAMTCFRYIHQNPMKAGLVSKIEDWEYSSFKDYCGLRNGTLCNKDLTFHLFSLTKENFYSLSNEVIPKENLKDIF